jgi:glycosyltransferase involved in cell wall biosynthesis
MKSITLLIPCLNEEKTIAKVVTDFKRELPFCKILVYDNMSTDKTVQEAKKAGAEVRECTRKGKGNVIRQAFEEVESDIYIMVDGDDTYDAKAIKKLLTPVLKGEADMTVGTRLAQFRKEEKRLLHSLGNKIILWQLRFCFPSRITDMLSGYRVMTRNVVKDANLLSSGFTIETELTIKTLENGYRVKEIPVEYKERPKGSKSKLSTFSDGYHILSTILSLFRDYRPMQFFILFSIFSFSLTVGFGTTVVLEVMKLGVIRHFGSLIAACFFLLLTINFVIMGFVSSSIHASKREIMNAIQRRRNI